MIWVLDFIPVVGTVKNITEWINCYVKGEGEGEEAAFKGMQALVGCAFDFATFGTGSSFEVDPIMGVDPLLVLMGAQIAAKKSAKQTITVTVGIGTKVIVNAAYRLIIKVSLYNLYYNPNFTEGVKVSEPIINNSVLDLYKDVVEEFVRDNLRDSLNDMVYSGRLSINSKVLQSINLPIPEQILNLLRNRLVVPFERNGVDSNFIIFDLVVQSLKKDLVAYMNCINNVIQNLSRGHNLLQLERLIAQSVQLRKSIMETVEEMIEGKYYFTENALGTLPKQSDIRDFHDARNGFDFMFKRLITPGDDILIEWVKEIREASKEKNNGKENWRKV
ncbi:uncharacterized protein [Palaemon carinicauda]